MKDVVAVGEERLVLRGADALAVDVELGPPEAAGVRLVPDHDIDDAGVAAQQVADEGAIGIACGVGLRRVGRGAVDGQHDAEVCGPGREDHPVDRDAVIHSKACVARMPRDGDAHGADPEIARVGEGFLSLRLLGPLEGVVVHSDEQARCRPAGAGEHTCECRAGGEGMESPAHGFSIGAGGAGHE